MTNAADFDAFVLACGPRLLRTARHLAADEAAGEDLLQTALTVVRSRWWRLQDTSVSSVPSRPAPGASWTP